MKKQHSLLCLYSLLLHIFDHRNICRACFPFANSPHGSIPRGTLKSKFSTMVKIQHYALIICLFCLLVPAVGRFCWEVDCTHSWIDFFQLQWQCSILDNSLLNKTKWYTVKWIYLNWPSYHHHLRGKDSISPSCWLLSLWNSVILQLIYSLLFLLHRRRRRSKMKTMKLKWVGERSREFGEWDTRLPLIFVI